MQNEFDRRLCADQEEARHGYPGYRWPEDLGLRRWPDGVSEKSCTIHIAENAIDKEINPHAGDRVCHDY